MDTSIAEHNMKQQLQHNPLTHSNVKPIIIYFFVNPFCHDCWKMEPNIKKLTLEYGEYFILRPILSHLFDGKSTMVNHSKTLQKRENLNNYYLLIGIKAAALQGNKASRDFLQTMQESFFQNKMTELNVADILLQCAKKANLDLHEFHDDLQSSAAKKAYQGDINLLHEMSVDTYPTLVIHSQSEKGYNIKVAGVQPYHIYVHVLQDMLHEVIKPAEKPDLLQFLKEYGKVRAEEISFIYNHPLKAVNNGLKQLQLQQKVKKVIINKLVYWDLELKKSRTQD